MVQEALTNARKHAAGRPVRVVLRGGPGDGLVIDVRNPLREDGGDPPPGSGTGLVGLTERVRLVRRDPRPPGRRGRVPAARLATMAA